MSFLHPPSVHTDFIYDGGSGAGGGDDDDDGGTGRWTGGQCMVYRHWQRVASPLLTCPLKRLTIIILLIIVIIMCQICSDGSL